MRKMRNAAPHDDVSTFRDGSNESHGIPHYILFKEVQMRLSPRKFQVDRTAALVVSIESRWRNSTHYRFGDTERRIIRKKFE